MFPASTPLNRWASAAAILAALVLAACARSPSAQPPPSASPELSPPTAATVTRLPPSSTPPSTRTSVPSPTTSPTITPTPAPILRPLTTGGCCVQPAWSPDGAEIWYIDRPSATDPSGLWAVPIQGGAPRFVTDRLGLRSSDGQFLAYPESGQTYIQSADGERWVVPSGGRPVDFSPDGARLAWQSASSTVNFDRRQVEIWIANLDGSDSRAVLTLIGGGLVDWFPDGQSLLISGRDEADRQSFYAVYDLASGSFTIVVEAPSLRGALVSPDGDWLAYQVTFSGDPATDGLWLVSLLGHQPPRRLDLYGAYRWRSANVLLILPLEPEAPAQRVVEIDAATGAARPLTDPAVTPLHIAGGDWALSPDGSAIVYVSAEDRSLWILELDQ